MDDSHEKWKPVIGYEDLFRVSSLGRVMRILTRYGNPQSKILSGFVCTTGYPAIEVQTVPRHIRKYIHSLVMESFVGPRPDGFQVNHIDGCKTNNRLPNLEYVTCQQNLEHAARLGLSTNSGSFKLDAVKVRALRRRYQEIGHCETVAAEFGIDESNVFRIVTRQHWKR